VIFTLHLSVLILGTGIITKARARLLWLEELGKSGVDSFFLPLVCDVIIKDREGN
jgi:hypothetical protein